MTESPIDPSGSARPRLLLVDDHDHGRRAMARLLALQGFDVVEAADGAAALARLGGPDRFDILLTDLRLPDLDGLEVIAAARRLEPAPRLALMTGWDVDEAEMAGRGVGWVFLKPVDIADLARRLKGPAPLA